MSGTAMQTKQETAAVFEKVLLGGDLAALSPEERIFYYNKTCESLGLNPLTRPFEYIKLNGKLTFYARKDATEQLRNLHRVNITRMESRAENDVYTVITYGCNSTGKEDIATGSVYIGGLKGEMLANAYMKAETKSKRRLTLSICGLGMLDETEIETIQSLPKPKDLSTPWSELPKYKKYAVPFTIEKAEQYEREEEKEKEEKENEWNIITVKKNIEACMDLSTLLDVYTNYYIQIKNNPELLKELIKMKDERKAALEFLTEYKDEPPEEIL